MQSVLRHRVTWWVVAALFATFGLLTWALEAVLLHTVPGAPAEPWGGVFRFVEAILWIGTLVIATAVAERWPIERPLTQLRRVVAQMLLGVLLGPLWGIIAYLLSTRLMPAWHSRGVWGIVGTEAKGALLGYVTTLILVHIVLRTIRQRAREVAAAEAIRSATESRLNALKLELHPESVLWAIDAVADLIPRDASAANDSLVMLADMLQQVVVSARIQDVSLREELAVAESLVRLHEITRGRPVQFSVAVPEEIMNVAVPHLFMQPIVDDVLRLWHSDQPDRQGIHVAAERFATTLVLRISIESSGSNASNELEMARGVVHA